MEREMAESMISMSASERIRVLVLNYNGREVMAECLPSVVESARASSRSCVVSVIDNDSTDDSLSWLSREWPEIEVFREPNRGLASFNSVLERIDESFVLLLNSDVKLTLSSIEPLVAAVRNDPQALFSAPLCWGFDGETYEGMRTRVRTRYGMIEGICRTPGHRFHLRDHCLTASSGPILAVDRLKFLSLGGYDPLYFPGRLEDLDLGFRAWIAGYTGVYVPESIAFHQGAASFGPAFGAQGCDRLAVRNTLLFTWKNLQGRRLASHFAWLPARLLYALVTGRKGFLQGFAQALTMSRLALRSRKAQTICQSRHDSFFETFDWIEETKNIDMGMARRWLLRIQGV